MYYLHAFDKRGKYFEDPYEALEDAIDAAKDMYARYDDTVMVQVNDDNCVLYYEEGSY